MTGSKYRENLCLSGTRLIVTNPTKDYGYDVLGTHYRGVVNQRGNERCFDESTSLLKTTRNSERNWSRVSFDGRFLERSYVPVTIKTVQSTIVDPFQSDGTPKHKIRLPRMVYHLTAPTTESALAEKGDRGPSSGVRTSSRLL